MLEPAACLSAASQLWYPDGLPDVERLVDGPAGLVGTSFPACRIHAVDSAHDRLGAAALEHSGRIRAENGARVLDDALQDDVGVQRREDRPIDRVECVAQLRPRAFVLSATLRSVMSSTMDMR